MSAAAEAVVVGVRVRPFNKREEDSGAEQCVEMEGKNTIINNPLTEQRMPFAFDQSFWSFDGFEELPDGYLRPLPGSRYADQRFVFDAFGRKVLDNSWQGYHCTLFAYGQTGAGKSYSMVGYGANKGIVPIICETVFERIGENKVQDLSFEITVSMVELYNEAVQDLLILPQERLRAGLQIRESKALGIYIEGVTKQAVNSYKSIESVIQEAEENRTVAATLMNATSSRAHTVVSIEFKQVQRLQLGGKEQETVKLSMINLVDLAGSEKASQTGAAGERLKEGAMINKSLSALGNVIEKLAEKSSAKGKERDKVLVPYRDSKLTRLLQNALGGSSKTIMICALSPASSNFEETLSTLRYADRAKKIKNTAAINENPQDKLLREMYEENAKLKAMIEAAGGGEGPVVTQGELREKKEEIARLAKALEESHRSFEERLQESQERRERQSQERLRRRRTACVEQSHSDGYLRHPMMVNLNEDIQLSGKKVLEIPRGKRFRIASIARSDSDSEDLSAGGSSRSSCPSQCCSEDDEDETPTIALAGLGVQQKHATVWCTLQGRCMLSCWMKSAQMTWVNGVPVDELLAARQREHGSGDERQQVGLPRAANVSSPYLPEVSSSAGSPFEDCSPLCPSGHTLLAAEYEQVEEEDSDDVMCDVCGRAFLPSAELWICGMCDWRACSTCSRHCRPLGQYDTEASSPGSADFNLQQPPFRHPGHSERQLPEPGSPLSPQAAFGGSQSSSPSSPGRLSRRAAKRLLERQSQLPGLELRHGDRIAFGRCIYVFCEPGKEAFEFMILSGQASFAKARKELPTSWRRETRAAGGRVSFVEDGDEVIPTVEEEDRESWSGASGRSNEEEPETVALLRRQVEELRERVAEAEEALRLSEDTKESLEARLLKAERAVTAAREDACVWEAKAHEAEDELESLREERRQDEEWREEQRRIEERENKVAVLGAGREQLSEKVMRSLASWRDVGAAEGALSSSPTAATPEAAEEEERRQIDEASLRAEIWEQVERELQAKMQVREALKDAEIEALHREVQKLKQEVATSAAAALTATLRPTMSPIADDVPKAKATSNGSSSRQSPDVASTHPSRRPEQSSLPAAGEHTNALMSLSATLKASFEDAISALDTAHFYLERSSAQTAFPRRKSVAGEI
eukprot:TRINITY_DN14356_c0_g4_i1.p1 TRINITY_DN14356_c0_g4~~TRINITY_DN14356_c0_g4_i1.p1  ORF type:complete len:1154 (+),score=338.69 TRINITY_DN14356_c0_g4_i1:119-3580(+)